MQFKRIKILSVSIVAFLLSSVILSSCVSQAGKAESAGQAPDNSSLTTAAAASASQASLAATPNNDPLNSSRLELVSQGIRYELIEHWVYSVQNGVVADGKWFDKLALDMNQTLKDNLTAAKEIPYSDDFAFMEVGAFGSKKVNKLTMNIFDENLNKIQNNVEKLMIPSQAGLYYVAVLFTSGDKDNGSGYQYIFKTRRE